MQSHNFDAIVVGGGHNGLVAGSYLAGFGLKVLIVERRDRVGGLCATAEIFPGLHGNQVANSAHNFEPKVLAELELERYGLKWTESLQPSSFISFTEGRRVASWSDPDETRREFDQFSMRDYDAQRGMQAQMTDLAKALDVNYFGPPPSFAQVASRPKTAAQEELFTKVMFGSASDLVREHLESEELQANLAMLAASGNFVGPDTPGSAFQLMHRSLYRGSSAVRNRPKIAASAEFASRAPIGGMGAISRALETAFLARGGTLITNATVEEITVGAHGVTGIVLQDGREFSAPIVATAMNPKATVTKLLPASSVAPEVLSAFDNLTMSGCMAKVYLALNDLPQFICAKDAEENRLLNRCGFRIGMTIDEMQQGFEAAGRGDWSGAPIVYGLVQTAADPSLSADGRHLMSMSVAYAPYHLAEGDWKSVGDDWAQHVIDALRPHISNLDQIVDGYRYLTPADLENEFGLLEGHALHGNLSAARAFNWRPVAGYSDYRGPVSGLYFCSNGSWPALYVSGLAGHNAAHEIKKDLRSMADGKPVVTDMGLNGIQ